MWAVTCMQQQGALPDPFTLKDNFLRPAIVFTVRTNGKQDRWVTHSVRERGSGGGRLESPGSIVHTAVQAGHVGADARNTSEVNTPSIIDDAGQVLRSLARASWGLSQYAPVSSYREVGSYGLHIQTLAGQPESYTSEVSLGKHPEVQLAASATASLIRRSTTLPSSRHSMLPNDRIDIQKVAWYMSKGALLASVPIPPAIARLAELYVHVVEGQRKPQVWLRVEPPAWVVIGERHPHPIMEGYVLRLLDNYEPRWVTKKTYGTYVTHWRKQGLLPRDARPS
ncbi:hypothetical protein DAEQUDRAFT_736433 [Daedalea quercina L-15889]|uniref:Uncharacterized protein n=1 Tax=Daedalea quercina L-15889 TaxID=1314783 RepID=A0A165SGE8_9APHY|nr:hypothetical protein DAEQUDRAFT_736433 [Daedalea quercina L-15889]